MATDEIQFKFNYLKWSIERKTNYINSFGNRLFGIIATNSIIISISSFINYNNTNLISSLFLIEAFLFILLFFGELILLIYIIIPRKSSVQLKLKEGIDETLNNMEEYDSALSIYLRQKALITRKGFRMFFAQIIIIISIFTIVTFSRFAFQKIIITLILLIETILILFILFAKDSVFLSY